MTELNERAQELQQSLESDPKISNASRSLILEAARIQHRLDLIDRELEGSPLTVKLYSKAGDEINEVANPLLSEARQQTMALRQVFASLGVGKLPELKSNGPSLMDLLAAAMK